MKRNIISYVVFIAMFVAMMLISTSCEQNSNPKSNAGESMELYYTPDDFQSIIVGKSTYQDVYEIAPTTSVTITSYGGICEYPTSDGKCIYIKFYGADMIVGAIELK